MCDTNRLHELNVSTDTFNCKDLQTTTFKTPSFPKQTSFKSFKYVDNNNQRDPSPAPPLPVSWNPINPSPTPPSIPSFDITTNTLSTSSTFSSSFTPSYSQSSDAEDDENGSNIQFTSTMSIPIPISIQRLKPLFVNKGDLNVDVCDIEPSKSESENHKDDNTKPSKPKNIWDEEPIDIPNSSDPESPSLLLPALPSPSPTTPVNEEEKAPKDGDIGRTAEETNDANEDHKDGDLRDDVEVILEIGDGSDLGQLDEDRSIVYKRKRTKHRMNPDAPAFHPRQASTQRQVPVLAQSQLYVYIQSAMLEIRDNINCHETNQNDDDHEEQMVYTANEVVQIFDEVTKGKKIKLTNECNKKKNNKRKKKQPFVGHRFIPQRPKQKYKIPRPFTRGMPDQIKEKIPGKNVYEFMVKMLGVINDKSNDVDTVKIIDFGLNDVSTEDPNHPKIYFKATRRDPTTKSKKKWKMDEMVNSNEVKQDDVLKPPTNIVNDTQMCFVESVLQNKQKLLAIINGTKWTKIPIYKQNNKKGETLTAKFKKDAFITKCVQFIDNVNTRDIQLIPIVMFDHNDKYVVEYVWIVRIKETVDIGISFRYNSYKQNGKHKVSVDVSGIYLNKNQILQQHHIASPYSFAALVLENTKLRDFRTNIDDLYIGDPEDDQNRIKDLRKKNDIKTDALYEFRAKFVKPKKDMRSK